MIIFVSKTSNTLNRFPYNIERITPYICLNPMYSSTTTEFPCNVLMDSGAYQDEEERVTLQQALERQQTYEQFCMKRRPQPNRPDVFPEWFKP